MFEKCNEKIVDMEFTLSLQTRKLIQYSTGMSPTEQKKTPVTKCSQFASEHQRKLYSCKDSRIINPRGSVYLHLKRILPLRTVKKYLGKI